MEAFERFLKNSLMSGEGDIDLKILLTVTTFMDFPSHGGLVHYIDHLFLLIWNFLFKLFGDIVPKDAHNRIQDRNSM